MKLGIKSKFIGILVVASALPLGIAIVAVWVLGHYYFQKERGILFQAEAVHLASSVNRVVQSQVEQLHDWLALSELPDQIQRRTQTGPGLTEAVWRSRAEEIQARWPKLTDADPGVQALLTNDVSRSLKAFQFTCPLFAQVFVTDLQGRVVGATAKPANYLQSGESWWQKALRLPPDRAGIEGIELDKDTGHSSLAVTFSIPSPSHPGMLIGTIKGTIDARALFSSIEGILPYEHPQREVMLGDGRVLMSISGNPVVLARGERVDPRALLRITERSAGWATLKLDGNELRLVGFTPIHFAGGVTGEITPAGPGAIYVIVHDDVRHVLAPVHRQFWILSVAGVLLLLTFSLAGLNIATSKIIWPIQLLRTAAQAIAATAHLEGGSTTPGNRADASSKSNPVALLQSIQQIDTGDEIEDLAHDFTSMARRVLDYHRMLKEEIAAKTAEMQRDLDIAREFQEALLPHAYPEVPSPGTRDALAIHFHHLYQPTSSVGGDFFDVIKLSDHRVGIFIADVMGHGARAALVTAMLRTLLQDLIQQADDPARFLTLMNQHFSGIIEQSSQCVFASAFYLILDTGKALATYASAGHPSPLFADRNTRKVSLLIEGLKNNPALGLYRDSEYISYSRSIENGDLFLLYTDGVPEAVNEQGEEFSRERFQEVVEQNLDHDAGKLTGSVMEAVNRFLGSAPLPDDVCLVTVEVDAAEAPARKTKSKASRA